MWGRVFRGRGYKEGGGVSGGRRGFKELTKEMGRGLRRGRGFGWSITEEEGLMGKGRGFKRGRASECNGASRGRG